MKVSISGRRFEITLHCEDWDLAWVVSKHNRAYPPTGYTHLSSLFRERRRSGRACDLTLLFQLVEKIPAIEQNEAYQLFELDKAVALGKRVYPQITDETLTANPS